MKANYDLHISTGLLSSMYCRSVEKKENREMFQSFVCTADGFHSCTPFFSLALSILVSLSLSFAFPPLPLYLLFPEAPSWERQINTRGLSTHPPSTMPRSPVQRPQPEMRGAKPELKITGRGDSCRRERESERERDRESERCLSEAVRDN